MAKITFLGAGSTLFARAVLGGIMNVPALADSEVALYDIDAQRLKESEALLLKIARLRNSKIRLHTFCGREFLREALSNAHFVINAVQVGGYECTLTDFDIPRNYGLLQTMGDTLGVGGIMRALRTIPVLEDFIHEIEAVCPNALFLNYSNPLAINTGFILRSGINAVGICHSSEDCSARLLKSLGMNDKLTGRSEKFAGINRMAWLLEIHDRNGVDLYPEIKKRAAAKNQFEKHSDMIRFDILSHFGFYCTESSAQLVEYTPFYLKANEQGRETIIRYNIPIDEYPRRSVTQLAEWKKQYANLLNQAEPISVAAPFNNANERSNEIIYPMSNLESDIFYSGEYASRIIESMVTGIPWRVSADVLNTRHFITNLPASACIEVPCLADHSGVHPSYVGTLPIQLSTLNMACVNVQLLTIEAAKTRKREHIYQAAMLDPHTAAVLPPDTIINMIDALIEAHGDWLPKFH